MNLLIIFIVILVTIYFQKETFISYSTIKKEKSKITKCNFGKLYICQYKNYDKQYISIVKFLYNLPKSNPKDNYSIEPKYKDTQYLHNTINIFDTKLINILKNQNNNCKKKFNNCVLGLFFRRVQYVKYNKSLNNFICNYTTELHFYDMNNKVKLDVLIEFYKSKVYLIKFNSIVIQSADCSDKTCSNMYHSNLIPNDDNFDNNVTIYDFKDVNRNNYVGKKDYISGSNYNHILRDGKWKTNTKNQIIWIPSNKAKNKLDLINKKRKDEIQLCFNKKDCYLYNR